MNLGIIYAIAAAITSAFWVVFEQQAASKINYLFGAIVVSLTASAIGLVFLLPKIKSTILFTNPKGVLFAALAGIFALLIDYFSLKSYGYGIPISVAGPIIIGGSIAVSSVIGFFMGDSVTLMKIFGLLLVIIGSEILVAFSA